MIKNVIFDLDGTLLDTSAGIIESIQYTVDKMGSSPLSHEQMLSFIGPSLQRSFADVCGYDENEVMRAVELFRERYSSGAMYNAAPYEGILSLCKRLRDDGIAVAVATNKKEDLARKVLSHFGFDKYCRPIHGADPNAHLKKSDIILLCMGEMNAASEETVMVGDTMGDAKGAREAGIAFLPVSYGFGDFDGMDLTEYHCAGIASSPADIGTYIRGKEISLQ